MDAQWRFGALASTADKDSKDRSIVRIVRGLSWVKATWVSFTVI